MIRNASILGNATLELESDFRRRPSGLFPWQLKKNCEKVRYTLNSFVNQTMLAKKLTIFWYFTHFVYSLAKNYVQYTLNNLTMKSGKQKRFCLHHMAPFVWMAFMEHGNCVQLFSFIVFYNKFIVERVRVFWSLEICYNHYTPSNYRWNVSQKRYTIKNIPLS